MKIIDTYCAACAVFSQGHFDLHVWRRYADGIAPGLAEKVEQDAYEYDYERDVLPVLERFFRSAEIRKQAHASFLSATHELQERIYKVLHTEIDVTLLLYLGLCNGAGWATDLHGRPAVLLGLEKIVELGWHTECAMAGLIYHELGHTWHMQQRHGKKEAKTPRDKALWQLYAEGVAMYCEQLLVGDFDFFHQDANGWLDWCRRNRAMLFAEYRRRVDAGESAAPFFGDWNTFLGQADVGYYLGAEIAASLAEQYGLELLANLDLDIVYAEISKFCDDKTIDRN